MPRSGLLSLVDELSALTERYLTSDIHGAALAPSEAEQLMRDRGRQLRSSGFALALILAKRSDLESTLGNPALASSLMAEAVELFSHETLALRSGLTTAEAVLRFVRAQEATGVKWRQAKSDGKA